MFKTLKRVLPTVLRGAGSAAVAALGWKFASDAYDAVKKRLQDKEPGAAGGQGDEEEKR